MSTHPHIAFGLLTRMRTRALFDLLDSGTFAGRRFREVRAVILIEIAYRLRIRGWYVAPAIWNIVFNDEVPPPAGLMSPSEAYPHERRWALH